ncbi:uncharacterized protein LOC124183030 isoform X1 [Neodiprion fabricii]|uniref:uncharacterized protein LOC124183030 isoform X1 n=2 Tax=Neodiprion fabricii TaxID=2872261 RepID=UPI001ED97F56|nr:uncharacterized protein LOC124183030 isoform X1 [Neodiprion fabricii]
MSTGEGSSKQRNQMSAKEIEAAEMAQELMSMEMYEDGMGYDQMKQILQVINESRDMAGIEPENRSSQEMSQYSQEMTGTEVALQGNAKRDLLSDENSLPKPSFSYRQQSDKVSPTASSRKSVLDGEPVEEMSLSSPELFTNEERNLRRSSTDPESIFDKLVKENTMASGEVEETQTEPLVKNAWQIVSDISQDSQNSPSASFRVNVENAKSRKNQRVERWKLDPTKSVIEESDVPLRQKDRPVIQERIPYNFCHHRKALDAKEKLLNVLTYQLGEVADIWRRKHRHDASEFQWGSPIKVGTNNGSLDKKPSKEEPSTPERRTSFVKNQESSLTRRNQDRLCKRKAVDHFRDVAQDQVDSDDENESIFDTKKKAKTSDMCWEPQMRSGSSSGCEKHLTRSEKMLNNLNKVRIEEPSLITAYNSDDFDNNDLASLRKKKYTKKVEEVDRISSPEDFVPRRIVPPNPSKPKSAQAARQNGAKRKRKCPVKQDAQAVLEKGSNIGTTAAARGKFRNPFSKETKSPIRTLTDGEITNELHDDETEENQGDIEIKPLKVKGLSSKLALGASWLLHNKNAEAKLEAIKMTEHAKLQSEEIEKRREIALIRLQKDEEERKQKQAKEDEMKAKEEKWRNGEVIRNKKRRARQMQQKQADAERHRQEIVFTDDDDDNIPTSININQKAIEERVQCPICLLKFSKAEIQQHAADCNQFDNVAIPGGSRSPASNDDFMITDDDQLLVCNICSKFSTKDGIILEDHCHRCLSKEREKQSNQTQFDSPDARIIEVPTSPIRCFIPISEQSESSINYTEQFLRKKRKRKSPANIKRRQ